MIHVGFDGKLPSRGDFIGAGLPRSFLAPWQAWIDAALRASRSAMGAAWLSAWLQAPIWRFALAGNACGPDPVLGLMMPSVDRVGRHYPLTVAAVFTGPRAAPTGAAWLDAATWLDRAEAVALDALAHDGTPEALMHSLAALAKPRRPDAPCWWTAGSPLVHPAQLHQAELPPATAFAIMIGTAA